MPRKWQIERYRHIYTTVKHRKENKGVATIRSTCLSVLVMGIEVFENYECEGQISLDNIEESENASASKQASKPRRVHCLFEQSGTFKNEFKKLGIDAYDYDIQNEFNQTDYIVDLFQAIEDAYDGKPSIFDDFTEDDLIMAFFPCTRFEDQIMLGFRGQNAGMNMWSDKEKLLYSMRLHKELDHYYQLISILVIISIDRKLQIVIENPYSAQHYLRQYWCIKPSLIDKDRTQRGDWYKKPTQYFFINRVPYNNIILEPFEYVERMRLKWDVRDATKRSMIHPQYANRFIREFILGEEFIQKQENEQLNLFKE